jgi:hypothetical protein
LWERRGVDFDAQTGASPGDSILVEKPMDHLPQLGAVVLDVGPQSYNVAG